MKRLKKLFALLVGINEYAPDSSPYIPSLRGCENDVVAMYRLLTEGELVPEDIECNVLPPVLNEQATYSNIIQCFRQHFREAEPGDTALFMFSGHGSREEAPSAFSPYFPSEKMETLVCYDSRTSEGHDLADKELGMLIEEISERGVHVCVILDCCHSGSGTRQLKLFPRRVQGATGRRTYESLLLGEYAKRYPIPQSKEEAIQVPAGKHVLLAACDRTEEAYEAYTRKGQRGLFSYCLEQVMKENASLLSYKSLFARARMKLMQHVTQSKQSPVIQAYSSFNIFEGFLGLGPGENPYQEAKIYYRDAHWRVNRGVINGNLPIEDKPTYFNCYQNGEKVGIAVTKWKGATESIIEFINLPAGNSEEEQYKALMISQAGSLLPIMLWSEDEPTLRSFEKEWSNQQLIGNLFEFTGKGTKTEYQVEVTPTQVKILRIADQCQLATFSRKAQDVYLSRLRSSLDHYGAWERLVKMNNTNMFERYSDEIQFELVILDSYGKELKRYSEDEIQVALPNLDGRQQQLKFQLEVKNISSSETWHCALIYMDEEYNINTSTLWNFNERIEPGEMALARGANNDLWLQAGEHEFTDIFKLFVSKEKLDLSVLTQSLKGNGITRRIGSSKDEPLLGQWFTKTITLQLLAEESEMGDRDWYSSTGELSIKRHKEFKAGLGLGTSTNIRHFKTEPQALIVDYARTFDHTLLPLGEKLSYIGAPNTLILSEINGVSSLSMRPLELEFSSREENCTVLPLTVQDGHIVPVGEWEYKEQQGETHINFSEIPEQPATRSLRKAAWFCFLKLVFHEDPYFLRKVNYAQEPVSIIPISSAQKFEDENHVLVLIHGLLGNSKKMAEAVRPLVESGSIHQVLAFEYENMNTTLEEIAGRLDELVKGAGLHAGTGQKLTILAHGMGGLIARYWVEKLGANTFVSRLVLVGTPNGGSALSDLAKWRDRLLTLLTLAINYTPAIPVTASLVALLGQSKWLSITLEQMRPGNSFMRNLKSTEDAKGVVYHNIIGNMEGYFKKHRAEKRFLESLLKKNAGLFFEKEANDLFSSKESMKSLPAAWLGSTTQEVDCNYLNYFESPESVIAIRAALQL